MENNRYRIKFTKDVRMRFVGHLDLMRLFQRTINKGNLPIAYSKGFNPHQQMSFALPLSLGYSSEAEYIDILLKEEMEENQIKNRLEFPEGIEIKEVIKISLGDKAAAQLSAALYEIEFTEEINFDEDIKNIMNSKEFFFNKKTKKGTAEVNIREDIFEIKKVSENTISALISAGSNRNLKPEVLVLIISKGRDIFVKYKRLEMFRVLDNKFIPLSNVL